MRLLLSVAVVAGAAGALLTSIWRQRAALPYNSEGRYFDAAGAVVYQEQAVAIYGGSAALAWIIAVAAVVWALRSRKARPAPPGQRS